MQVREEATRQLDNEEVAAERAMRGEPLTPEPMIDDDAWLFEGEGEVPLDCAPPPTRSGP